MKDLFCSHCGTAHEDESYPKTCPNCAVETWLNDFPVAVAVQPVFDPTTDKMTLAIGKRAIEPRLGTWNLFAGHNNPGESFEASAAREFKEETGLEPGEIIGISASYCNGPGHVLVAVQFHPILLDVWKTARLCPENIAFSTYDPSEHLGFPIHDEIAREWWLFGRDRIEANAAARRALDRGHLLELPGAYNKLREAVSGSPAGEGDSSLGLDHLFRPYLDDLMTLARAAG